MFVISDFLFVSSLWTDINLGIWTVNTFYFVGSLSWTCLHCRHLHIFNVTNVTDDICFLCFSSVECRFGSLVMFMLWEYVKHGHLELSCIRFWRFFSIVMRNFEFAIFRLLMPREEVKLVYRSAGEHWLGSEIVIGGSRRVECYQTGSNHILDNTRWWMFCGDQVIMKRYDRNCNPFYQ
jgi:hypothetical protein